MAVSVQARSAGFDEWLQSINAACGRFCANTLGPGFSGTMRTYHTHALRLSIVDAAQAQLYRTRREIAHSNGGYFFTVFQLRGSALMEQGERRASLSAGDMTLIDAGQPSNFLFQQDSQQISLLLPRDYLEAPARQGKVQCAVRLEAGSSLVRFSHQLVRGYLDSPTLAAAESEATLSALASLLRPLLAGGEGTDAENERGFKQALSFIDRHIQSEHLRPEWVADECGMSLRTLYRLFARHGLVVAQYIKHRRLELCAQALRHAPPRQKLSHLSDDWGFRDHSHFSTAFKTHFGVSPSEYRRRYQ